MKNSFLILSLLFFTAFLITSCDSDNSTGPGNEENGTEYFPNIDGAYYKYNVNRTDSNGIQTTGTRSVNYNGTKPGTAYQRQIDSSTFGAVTVVSESYFRKTNAGVYYFLDTTGLASNIPPQYQQYISSLQIDTDLILIVSPLQPDWPVFKIILTLTNASIIDVKATNEGTEAFNNGAVSGEAVKIKYDVVIALPLTPAQTLTAFCWFFPDVGIVRWEGNATVINALSGGGIDFGDSTVVFSQDLNFYDLTP
jgi:hypothetical protein